MNAETVYAIDWSRVSADVIRMLSEGKARIVNGVARDVVDGAKILQHMPFTPVNYAEGANLLESARMAQAVQGAVAGAVALSTLAVMGSIVVATAYLARKIDKMRAQLDQLQRELQDQNLIYYLDKAAHYFGVVVSLRELMVDNNVLLENQDAVVFRISQLAVARNDLLLFLNSLIDHTGTFSVQHRALAMDFINGTLNLVPKGVFVESQAAYKIDRIHLGDQVRAMGEFEHTKVLKHYRGWANERYKEIVAGKTDGTALLLRERMDSMQSLMSSEENRLLMEHSI